MSVRIYKDNLRQPIFRTLVLTDVVIFVIIGTFIAAFTYLIYRISFHNINWLSYLFILSILEPSFVVIATLRIDNQQIYKILSRALIYSFTGKKYRGNQLGEYYNGFTIQDDLIVRKRSIAKVFRINPYDISALNAVDRESFFANLKQTLHILPSQLQIVVRKEVATAKDFTDHFMHVYKTLPKRNKKKEEMVANYQSELEQFIEREQLLTIKQYGVFSINVDTANISEKVKAIGKLADMYRRLSSSLESSHITTSQLTNNELEDYMRRLLR
jgi:hypothetical protein